MKKSHYMLSSVALLALIAIGCSKTTQPSSNASADSASVTTVGTTPAVLCGKCGQIKGSALCCVAGAQICEKCGLVEGSPGCCVITKGTDTKLCTKCGQVKGSKLCCVAGAEKCEKCGLAKGSPGCCKLKL